MTIQTTHPVIVTAIETSGPHKFADLGDSKKLEEGVFLAEAKRGVVDPRSIYVLFGSMSEMTDVVVTSDVGLLWHFITEGTFKPCHLMLLRTHDDMWRMMRSMRLKDEFSSGRLRLIERVPA